MRNNSVSTQELLIPPPNFSEYDGGDQFRFNKKIFRREGSALGNGGYGRVFCFRANDGTEVAVKCEIASKKKYLHGENFQSEAAYYQHIYNLGEFSGDAKKTNNPHYILMPYFDGTTLSATLFNSLEHVFFCWIKTAEALNQLHKKHLLVHGDFKSDNIIMTKTNAAIIDFGFTKKIGEKRELTIYDSHYHREKYSQHAPELFSRGQNDLLSKPAQDIYSLGVILSSLYALFKKEFPYHSPSINTIVTVHHVIVHSTDENPVNRWSIERCIFMIASTFFSRIPARLWQRKADFFSVQTIKPDCVLQSTWRELTDFAIEYRCAELRLEQRSLEDEGKNTSDRKDQKIKGLKHLRSQIHIHGSNQFAFIKDRTEIRFPELTAGFFSKRTRTLLAEIDHLAPLLH